MISDYFRSCILYPMKCPHKTHLNTKLGHRGLVQLYTTYYLSTTLSLFHCTVTRTCSMVACEGACARLEIWECLSATLISSNFKMRRRKRLTAAATAARSRRSFCCCFLRLANVDRISHSTTHQCHFFFTSKWLSGNLAKMCSPFEAASTGEIKCFLLLLLLTASGP